MSYKTVSHLFFGVVLGHDGVWENDPEGETFPSDLDDVLYDLGEYGAGELFPKVETIKDGHLDNGGGHEFLFVQESLIQASIDHCHVSLQNEPLLNRDAGKETEWVKLLQEYAEKLGLPWEKIEKGNPEGPRWILTVSRG